VYNGNEPIVNFEIPENFRFIQMDHVIFGVDWDYVYHLYPDKISNKNVAWSKTLAGAEVSSSSIAPFN
jgi:hypothetical protein